MVIADTMPYEDGYAQGHIPDSVPFLLPLPDMDQRDDAGRGGQGPED